MAKKTEADSRNEDRAPEAIFDDLEALRKRQDFDALVGTSRSLTSVPVAKPRKQMWFRTHPGAEWQIPAALLEWEDDGTQFFVNPSVAADLAADVKRVLLRTVVTSQGSVRLWPIRFPNPDGTDNPWFEIARRVAAQAETAWTRMTSNRQVQGYDCFTATANFGEPAWPKESFQDLLRIAFAGKVIESLDHPVVQRLLGRKS